jgi:hypothetical protein
LRISWPNRYFEDPAEDKSRRRSSPFLDALFKEFPSEKVETVSGHPDNDEIYVASSFNEKDGPIQLSENMCSNIDLQSLLLNFPSSGSVGSEVWTVWIIVERKNPPEQLTFYDNSPTCRTGKGTPGTKGTPGPKRRSSSRKPLIKPDPEGSTRKVFIKPDPDSITQGTRKKVNTPTIG